MDDTQQPKALEIERLLAEAIARKDWKAAKRLIQAGEAAIPTRLGFLSLRLSALLGQKRWRSAFRAYAELLALYPLEEATLFPRRLEAGVFSFARFSDYRERNHLYLIFGLMLVTVVGLTALFKSGVYACAVSIVAVVVASIAFELSCRAWLWAQYGIRGEREAFPNSRAEPRFFDVMDRATQAYHPVRGYDMIPNIDFVRVGVLGNRVVEVHAGRSDANGNVGFSDENTSDKGLNVLVLGDSYTSFPGNGSQADGLEGVEWPFFLKRNLVAAGFEDVRVLNYGRSGHGLLQMADTAVSLLDRHKPDVVVFAFITRDLTRFRYWHISREVGGQVRCLRLQKPDENAPLSICNDQNLVDGRITLSWAQERLQKGDRDELLDDLIGRYQNLRRRNSARAIDLLSRHRLYFLDRLLFGASFIDMQWTPRAGWLKTDQVNYIDDAQFTDAIGKIKASGAKIVLLHLPVKEELVPGASGAVAGIQESLDSLKQGVGEDISAVGALFKIDPDTVGRKYARYPHDAHPSAWAQKLFAAGLTQMITSTPLAASFKKRSQA